MNRKLKTAVLALGMVSLMVPAFAHRYHRNDDGHPLRLVAHVLHPIGLGLEYAIFRPVHYLASQPDMDILLGHEPYIADQDTYFEWLQADYDPSIGVEMAMREKAVREEAK